MAATFEVKRVKVTVPYTESDIFNAASVVMECGKNFVALAETPEDRANFGRTFGFVSSALLSTLQAPVALQPKPEPTEAPKATPVKTEAAPAPKGKTKRAKYEMTPEHKAKLAEARRIARAEKAKLAAKEAKAQAKVRAVPKPEPKGLEAALQSLPEAVEVA